MSAHVNGSEARTAFQAVPSVACHPIGAVQVVQGSNDCGECGDHSTQITRSFEMNYFQQFYGSSQVCAAGLLTLDPRKKERSKVNQPGARAKWIWYVFVSLKYFLLNFCEIFT
ncbi:hypothetical protein TELCIR_16730 [Teladorsagia circumcincta]|uniref:Uncharacterized protein n=1 Tax=Teladorsagia circumcincta TaxID=45464 RepID=A0A2G9TUY3_TELCI|nr:hypothetical protein TELCIR_16730 [Teladorsagia circumcincta]